MTTLKAGDPAPEFTLLDQAYNLVSLSDFSGRRLLIYFYPEADTPGCTIQSRAVSEAKDELEGLGVDVVGISPDQPDSQAAFDRKFSLGFSLLSDPEHEVAVAYGVWGSKQTGGRTYDGVLRSSFLVDASGRIEQAWYKVRPQDTVPRAREAIASTA
jgi:thioredoxin-dependent peroxiredoxin